MAGRLAVHTRRAVEADIPALIDLARRSWLSGNCELAPLEAVRDWMDEDRESRRYPEIWRQVTVAEHRSRILGLSHADGREVADLRVHRARGYSEVTLPLRADSYPACTMARLRRSLRPDVGRSR